MTLSILSPEADELTRRLAEIEQMSITDAVVVALKEAISTRIRKETPSQRRSAFWRNVVWPSD